MSRSPPAGPGDLGMPRAPEKALCHRGRVVPRALWEWARSLGTRKVERAIWVARDLKTAKPGGGKPEDPEDTGREDQLLVPCPF